MRGYSRRLLVVSAVIVFGLALISQPVRANVNLELRPVAEPCASGHLAVALYAVSDSPGNQAMSGLDVILSWDSTLLQLSNIDNTVVYPYQWLFSGFLDDSQLDGLNNTWNDGNAMYEALGQLGQPVYATPSGLLVTQLVFRKLRVGIPTVVSLLPSYGQYSHTMVYDGIIPGNAITGTLTSASLTPSTRGDLNCDSFVDFKDINPFVQLLSDPAGWAATYPGCPPGNGDLNCDGAIDFKDINPFVARLSD
jgi:hypothetical protein